jgi:hypothetical protein
VTARILQAILRRSGQVVIHRIANSRKGFIIKIVLVKCQVVRQKSATVLRDSMQVKVKETSVTTLADSNSTRLYRQNE